MVDLADCLAPVAEEMEALERELRRELRTDSAALSDLIGHVSRYAGKRLRPALVFLSAKAAGQECGEEHVRLAVIVELIHTATLVHDDILDGADVRRRVATLNHLHGNQVPVLLGDYLYAHAFAMSVELSTPVASRLLARVTKQTCRGEIEQIFERFDFDLDERRYFEIIEAKTAELYAASCELGARYAGAEPRYVEALGAFGRRIGVAFQVIDDCLDLIGDEEVVGKSLGTDLDGGKMTLPLIRLAQTSSPGDRERLRRLILEETDERRRRLSEAFDLRPAIDYALERADGFIRDAVERLEPLPPSPAKDALRAVADFVLCRRR